MRSLFVVTLLVFTTLSASAQIKAFANTDSVGCYDLFEITIQHVKSYPNNWEDVTVKTVFSGPETITISGFYYDKDTWKIRFAAPKTGRWRYEIDFITPFHTFKADGQFICIASRTKGFLQKHPTNNFRLIHPDGSLFNGIGIGDCILDLNKNGTPHDDWGFDGDFKPANENRTFPLYYGSTTSIENYFSAYGAEGAKFNLFRWSLDNCSFRIYNTISTTGNTYSIENGIWGDSLVKCLRKNNIRLWTTFFGPPVFRDMNGSTPMEEMAIKRYINYMVARYGAFTDIWELFNEAYCSDYYLQTITGYIRSIDPYKKLISISWEKPEHKDVDVNSPHWYEKESETESDIKAWNFIGDRKKWNKPVIIGEQGNSGQNWDRLSAVRMRIRSWTAFFAEGIFIFWNASWTKDYLHAFANIYLGPTERTYIRALQTVTEIADSAIAPFQITAHNHAEVRGYGLRSSKYILGYFHHYSTHSTQTTTKFNYWLHQPATIYWINPANNHIIDSGKLSRGFQTIYSPDFDVDVAMKIKLDTRESTFSAEEPLQIITYPNPSSTYFTIEGNFIKPATIEVFDLYGRRVMIKSNVINNQRIQVSGFTKGTYFYRVTTSDNRVVQGKQIVY